MTLQKFSHPYNGACVSSGKLRVQRALICDCDARRCWSMGHPPCSIQRGLTRRLCILLVCTGDSLKSYHHARKKKLHLPRNEKIRSWCESTGKWELRSRKRNRNELRVYASCAPCKHGRAQDGWECWSMGHPL